MNFTIPSSRFYSSQKKPLSYDSDGSEVWSITTIKRDTGECDSDIENSIYCNLNPKTNFPPNFHIDLNIIIPDKVTSGRVLFSLDVLYRNGEIVYLTSDGLLWPCIIVNSKQQDQNIRQPKISTPNIKHQPFKLLQDNSLHFSDSEDSISSFPDHDSLPQEQWSPIHQPGETLFSEKYRKYFSSSSSDQSEVESMGDSSDWDSPSDSENDLKLATELKRESDENIKYGPSSRRTKKRKTYSSPNSSHFFQEISKNIPKSNHQSDAHLTSPINLYTIIPLPIPNHAWEDIFNQRTSSFVKQSCVENVSETDLKPWLIESMDPADDDINLNLSLLQATHYSGSWAVSDEIFQIMEQKQIDSFKIPLEHGSEWVEDKLLTYRKSFGKSSKISNEAIKRLTMSLTSFRFGTEILRIGDYVRLVTSSRKTRNLVISPTYNILVLTHIIYSSIFTGMKWDQSIIIVGMVCEPHALKAGLWVTTGEVKKLDISKFGISGKWYNPYPKLARKMPVVEQELMKGIGIIELRQMQKECKL